MAASDGRLDQVSILDEFAQDDLRADSTYGNADAKLSKPASSPLPTSAPQKDSDAYTGLLLVLLSTVAFAVMSYCVDEIDDDVPVLQTASVRFWAQFGFTALMIPIARWKSIGKLETWLGQRKNWWKLMMRGGWGVFGLSCFFATIQSLSIADATAVVYVNIPLTALFARLILKEPYGKADAAAFLLAFVGVLFVAQPPALFGGDAAPVPLPALGIAFFGSCCSAMAYVSIRMIGKGEDALVVVLWFSVLGSVAVPIMCLLLQEFKPFPSGRTALLELGTGLFGFTGQVFLNAGMQRAPAALSSGMRYADILWSLLIQGVIQGKPGNAWKYVGCALIMSTLVSTVYKSRAKAMEEKEKGKATDASEGRKDAAGEGQGEAGKVDDWGITDPSAAHKVEFQQQLATLKA